MEFGAFLRRHGISILQRPAVVQTDGDFRGVEGMAADPHPCAEIGGAALNHSRALTRFTAFPSATIGWSCLWHRYSTVADMHLVTTRKTATQHFEFYA
jgi:hypothetical protein